MNLKSLIASAAIALATATGASALTVDTNPTWDGSINDGWDGSGQSLSIMAGSTTLQDISFYFDAESAGKTFSFTITDALVGGTNFFSSSFTALTGINVFNTNLALAAGSTVYALFDYNGFSGKTAHFSYTDGYAGGQSYFENSGWDTSYTTLDHRFIANFDSVAPIPLPAAGFMLLGGLGAFGALRRRKKKAA